MNYAVAKYKDWYSLVLLQDGEIISRGASFTDEAEANKIAELLNGRLHGTTSKV